MPHNNFILVTLGIQIPFDNDDISVKAMWNANPDQDITLTPKMILFKYATAGIEFISPRVYSNPAITSMNGKPPLAREKNAIPLLSKPALCVCAQLRWFMRWCRPKTQPTYGWRALNRLPRKRLDTVWAGIRLLCVLWVLAAVAVAVWKRLWR